MKKKNPVGGPTALKYEAYYRANPVKTVCCWDRIDV